MFQGDVGVRGSGDEPVVLGGRLSADILSPQGAGKRPELEVVGEHVQLRLEVAGVPVAQRGCYIDRRLVVPCVGEGLDAGG